MEGRIRQLEHLLENAEIIEAGDDGAVAAGTIVTIMYEGDTPDMAETLPRGPHGGEDRRPRRDEPAARRSAPRCSAPAEGHWVEYEAPNGMLRVQVLKVELA